MLHPINIDDRDASKYSIEHALVVMLEGTNCVPAGWKT